MIYLILGLIIAFIYILGIHDKILKWLPYRWILNSLLFPYTYFKVKKELKNKNALDKTYYLTGDYWFKKYWFGRIITRMVHNSFILLLVLMTGCAKMEVQPEFNANKDIVYFETDSECSLIITYQDEMIVLNSYGQGFINSIQVDKGINIEVLLNSHKNTKLMIYTNEYYKSNVYSYSPISFSFKVDNELIRLIN